MGLGGLIATTDKRYRKPNRKQQAVAAEKGVSGND